MKRSLAVALSSLVLLVAAAPNWPATVTLGVDGAHVIGNPKARVRVVEYLSYTCSHCAHFTESATGVYRTGAVGKGQAAWEVRNLVRDRYDLAAAVLARCGGPSKFIGNTEAIMAAQTQWLPVAASFDQANGARLSKLTPAQGIAEIAAGTGLSTILAKRGFTPAQIKVCGADPAALKAVMAMTKGAALAKVNYTPYFQINGKEAERISTWPQLEAVIGQTLSR